MNIQDIKVGDKIVIAGFVYSSKKLRPVAEGKVINMSPHGRVTFQNRGGHIYTYDPHTSRIVMADYKSVMKRNKCLMVLAGDEELTWDRPDFVSPTKQTEQAKKYFPLP